MHSKCNLCAYHVTCLYNYLFMQQSAAYLYDAFNILLDAMDSASLTIPNFTHIQLSCETLQEWEYGRAFQEILKEVNTYNHK